MKKVTIVFLSLLLLFLNVLPSCSKLNNYLVTYPQDYTTSYCSENYIQADPNLMYLRSADNAIGTIEIPGGSASYYAIKDIPLDEYLLKDEAVLFAPLSYKIVKNKNNNNLPTQEILSYTVKSVTLYLVRNERNNIDKNNLGSDLVDEYVVSISGEEAIAFQSHIIECLENDNYRETGLGGDLLDNVIENGKQVCLRISFEDYDNLVWDSNIYMQNDVYYIVFYTLSEETNGYWVQNWLPLYEEFVKLLP